nr:MAG TPA: hypothetical protein [Caudoviricetes sp.]
MVIIGHTKHVRTHQSDTDKKKITANQINNMCLVCPIIYIKNKKINI